MLPSANTTLQVRAFTATSCLGAGLAATSAALLAERSGLERCAFETVELDTWVGEVPGLDQVALPSSLSRYDCRNNRLAMLALQQDDFAQHVAQAAQRYGPSRIGVFLGTSTSGMLQAELAYRERQPDNGALPAWLHYAQTQNTYSVSAFVREWLGLTGPALVVSTACSSSAKVFSVAQRMLALGCIDVALVGGVDSLCLTTLYGFHSLQLLAEQPCSPYDLNRRGISIGEAGAFMLLERINPQAPGGMVLRGVGESSDAHHMSTPHPQGLGAQQAMQAALHQAGWPPGQVDYLNLHGTATMNNDLAEGKAVSQVFAQVPPCSSSKGWTGHTLGAAGALEAVISLLALQYQVAWGTMHLSQDDPQTQVSCLRRNQPALLHRVMSNSFGFGGSNCSLVFERLGAS